MNIEKTVCSIEQAMKLKELGVLQESTWYFALKKDGSIQALVYKRQKDGIYINPENSGYYTDWKKVSAFSVAELGMMLPDDPREPIGNLEIFKEFTRNFTHGGKFKFCRTGQYEPFGNFDTEAEARAALLLHGIENQLKEFTILEINQRISKSLTL